MKLIIDGREYDGDAQPFIGDLRLLKPQFGFGYGEVIRRLSRIDGDEQSFVEMLDDDDFLEAFVAWIWMARLRAGDREVTVDDVWQTPLDGIQFVTEPGGELPEDGSVPTSARTDSAPGVDSASPEQSTKNSTKTSKKRSTAA